MVVATKVFMDPKTFAKLDPKLRETYERVMGTSVPQKPTIIPAPQTNTTPPPATTQATPVETATNAVEHTSSPPPVTVPVVTKETTEGQSTTPTRTHNTIAVHTAVSTPPPHDEKTEIYEPTTGVPAWKKILFIVLGIIFFGTYATFWLLFFKVKLPF